MTASVLGASVGIAIGRHWAKLDLTGHDHSPRLSGEELHALLALGDAGVRRSRARGAAQRAPLWAKLGRLVAPLDCALASLDHCGDARYRRAGLHAAGLVLGHCVVTERSYWGWTSRDWEQLLGPSVEEFLAARTLPTETTVRPFLVALACLLGDFDQFQHLGTFNRLHLTQLVFGAGAVEASFGRVAETLEQWGYRDSPAAKHQLRGVISQAFLVNGSPLLEDLSTENFARLREHPATGTYQLPVLYALQRAVAVLGHCDPPVRTGHNAAPVIEGAHPDWVRWIERWHATSTLTPKVRAIIRTIMAKAGRWLAAEHPEITEPAQWTRQVCAAWVAAVDRMAVGD